MVQCGQATPATSASARAESIALEVKRPPAAQVAVMSRPQLRHRMWTHQLVLSGPTAERAAALK